MAKRSKHHNKLFDDHTLCQKHYPIRKLAEMFDLSERTLRRMIVNRQVKARRIGGSIRIPHSELRKIVRDYHDCG